MCFWNHFWRKTCWQAVFSSMTRNVTDSKIVRKSCASRGSHFWWTTSCRDLFLNDEKCYWSWIWSSYFFWRTMLWMRSLLKDNMLECFPWSDFRNWRKMCRRTSLGCGSGVRAGFAFYYMMGPVRWSVVLVGFGFLCVHYFSTCRSYFKNRVWFWKSSDFFEDDNHY